MRDAERVDRGQKFTGVPERNTGRERRDIYDEKRRKDGRFDTSDSRHEQPRRIPVSPRGYAGSTRLRRVRGGENAHRAREKPTPP